MASLVEAEGGPEDEGPPPEPNSCAMLCRASGIRNTVAVPQAAPWRRGEMTYGETEIKILGTPFFNGDRTWSRKVTQATEPQSIRSGTP